MRLRRRIECVPDIPTGFGWSKIGVGMEVKAEGDKWRWSTFYTFDGDRSLIDYSWPIRSRPSPYEVTGTTRDQGKAWDRAREAADDARARFTAVQFDAMRVHTDHVPL